MSNKNCDCETREFAHDFEIPYAYQIAEAFVIVVPVILTMWSLALLVLLRFGNKQVNRLTLRPLWWTLFVSVVQIGIGIFQIFMIPNIIWFDICQDYCPDLPAF